MKLVTSKQMQEIDRRAIDGLGIPGIELMENAGRGIADLIKELFNSETKGRSVAVFCGKGNNGGDGFVIARYLKNWSTSVKVFIFCSPSDFQGDALTNYHKIKNLDIPITEITTPDFLPAISGIDLIVDAIFGTGFHGTITGIIGQAVGFINSSGIPILAVDTPSGLDNDTGLVEGICIKAKYTSTLALPKLGQYLYPGKAYCGQIKVIDIGIPDKAINQDDLPLSLITPINVRKMIPDRLPTAHKGDTGKLFIVAGSEGMTGAAALTAESAVKAGCGLVYLGIPKSLNDILEIKLTEPITKPLAENRKKRSLPLRALGQILEYSKDCHALCFGPGIGRHYDTIELCRRLLSRIQKPTVLDADGLFPFSEKPQLIKNCRADLVLTPHLGEFARLCGKTIDEVNQNRIKVLFNYTQEIGKVVLLKGAPTLIASPQGDIFLSPSGNSGMATGGSGDVLSGIIGALLAYGLSAINAACCGAFIHGLAGDIAQKEVGTFGMTASDICRCLPKALKIIKG